MTRKRLSLDGLWQFAPCGEEFEPSQVSNLNWQEIQVPAPWQAQAEFRDFSGPGLYRHEFHLSVNWRKGDSVVILGFGAVDYLAEVWVNDQKVGEHEGGYLPFEFDISHAVVVGENTVLVRVTDPVEIFNEIPHGKQSWYGQLSGLWQPVWLEKRSAKHIRRVKITTFEEHVDLDIDMSAVLDRTESIRIDVLAPSSGEIVAQLITQSTQVSVPVEQPLLWDLDSPNLYQLRVRLISHENPDETMDTVIENFGFRTIETQDGKILLNGRPIYLRAALDQDYYPQAICTPPSLDYLINQFQQAKALGLNCVRVHIKVADPRYYIAADQVGILVWTELPNWIHLSEAAKQRAEETLVGMVNRDFNHPSIIIWTIINESWGVDLTNPEHRAWLAETYHTLKQLDPSRLVVGNSACWGNFQVVTDLEDFHMYYAMPDHYTKWRDWVANFAQRPDWTFAHEYQDYQKWRDFLRNPWLDAEYPPASENQRHGDEPLLVSEFGNWGLPDIEKLYQGYQGEPWWFETGMAWGDGVVYPHGVERRFKEYHLNRVFPSLSDLSIASQRSQFEALKYEIEQIRRHNSIQGYVITELTDVHWECNGLMDMLRNPKIYALDMRDLNADDLLIPNWERVAFWSGEVCIIDLCLSHYSFHDLSSGKIIWRLDGFPEICGEIECPEISPTSVTSLDQIRFVVPKIEKSRSARLYLSLENKKGVQLAYNYLDLYLFPRFENSTLRNEEFRIFAPQFATVLQEMGLSVVHDITEATCVITDVMTDELRAYLLTGGRVLWLAENDNALQTHLPGIDIRPRQGTAWQGDWASSLSWLKQVSMFSSIPVEGTLNFAFADLTPDHVIMGLPPHDFANKVYAGLFVGWLHKVVALIAEKRVGRGNLLISTLQLKNNLLINPVAQSMFEDLVDYLCMMC